MTKNFFEKEKEVEKLLKKLAKQLRKFPKKDLRRITNKYMRDYFMLQLDVNALEEYMTAEGDYAKHLSKFIHRFEEKT